MDKADSEFAAKGFSIKALVLVNQEKCIYEQVKKNEWLGTFYDSKICLAKEELVFSWIL